jgi:hypothetical protein
MTDPIMKKRLPTIVSYSELSTIRDCGALWGFKYGERLRPIVMPDILVKGRIAHAGFKAGYDAFHTKDLAEVIARGVAAAERELREHIATRDLSSLTEDHRADVISRDEETFELERWVVRHHFESTAEDLEHQVPLLVEHRFKLPIPNRAGRAGGLYLIGDIDLVTWDRRYQHLVTHEHKTTGMGVDAVANRLEMDPQTAGYVHAVKELLRQGVFAPAFWKAGIDTQTAPVGQVFYNVSRRKVPSEPNVNKDGTVSTAACDTTPDRYQRALDAMHDRFENHPKVYPHHTGTGPEWLVKAHAAIADKLAAGKEPTKAERERVDKAEARWSELKAKQADMLDGLRGAADPFFRRYEYHRTDEEIERWREEAWVDASRIRAARRDPKLRTRNPGNCMFRHCEFFDVCLDPNDATIRDAQFVTRESREAVPAAKEEQQAPSPTLGF